MTTATPFDLVIVAILVWLAAGALFTGSVSRSGVLFIVFGLTMAVAWVRLGAPDIALAEAAIGAGVIGVLILSAALRTERPEPVVPRWSRARLARVIPVVAAGSLAALLLAGVGWLPTEPGGLGPVVAERLDVSGASNPVTAVLLNFRAYDTALEIGVLAATAISLLAIRRRPDLEGVAVPEGGDPMLDGFVRQAAPVVVLVAVVLLAVGTFGPGGAFQAGAMLGALGVLLHLAGRPALTAVPGWALRVVLVFGLGVFLLAAALPLVTDGVLLAVPPSRATATIVAVEVAVTVSIAAILTLLFVAATPPTEPGADPT